MYTGSFTGGSGSHTYLVRTDINDPNNPTSSEKNAGAYVIGLAIDEDTGFLYVGTTDNTTDTIRVYNTLTWPSDPCFTLNVGGSGPAGMCLGDNIEYNPPSFTFSKIDTNNPHTVLPGNTTKYRITYGPNGISHNNVVIRDFLPGEVNYLSSDGNYNPANRTVTWNIGNISAGAGNSSVDINVQVNNGADPNGVITNFCEIESDVAYKTATCSTNVGSWQPNSSIIYVDCYSPCSPGTGVSWRYAYRDLQDALDIAATGRGSQICVARGSYLPIAPDQTFTVYKGIPVYGHFAGNETSLSQRNLNNPNNQTLLTGIVNSTRYIVTISNDDSGNYLDGFTIGGATSAGVRLEDANLYITNCLITENYDGIESYDSNFTVFDCNIWNNNNGIFADFQNTPDTFKTVIKNNIIRNNSSYGIYFQNISSRADILNNLIYNNGEGIYFYPISGYDNSSVIQNNTIVKNTHDGIGMFSSIFSPII
jgi:hypothetical protein